MVLDALAELKKYRPLNLENPGSWLDEPVANLVTIGIDLGTSTSEAAYLKDGKPELIPNTLGGYITPSIVYVNAEGVIKVGEEAKSFAVLEPENTVIEVKRLMG